MNLLWAKGEMRETPPDYYRDRNAPNLGVFKIHKFVGST